MQKITIINTTSQKWVILFSASSKLAASPSLLLPPSSPLTVLFCPTSSDLGLRFDFRRLGLKRRRFRIHQHRNSISSPLPVSVISSWNEQIVNWEIEFYWLWICGSECLDGSVVFRFGDESEKAAFDDANKILVEESNVEGSEVEASPASSPEENAVLELTTAVVSVDSFWLTFTLVMEILDSLRAVSQLVTFVCCLFSV